MPTEVNPSLGRASEPIAFFCSRSCSGDVILKAQDWANARSPISAPVIGGFHTPVERDVLRVLLRSDPRFIVCLARTAEGFRRSSALKFAEHTGRTLIISPFPPSQRHTTAASAEERNRYIIGKAHSVLIAHAFRAGKTEALAHLVVATGKQLWTFRSPNNASLVALEAAEIEI